MLTVIRSTGKTFAIIGQLGLRVSAIVPGRIFGGMNTMYTAVAGRTGEARFGPSGSTDPAS